jgi:hypothetical protein
MRLLYPTDILPHGSPQAQVMVETFLNRMENIFGMERIPIDITAMLLKKGYNGQRMAELGQAYAMSYQW